MISYKHIDWWWWWWWWVWGGGCTWHVPNFRPSTEPQPTGMQSDICPSSLRLWEPVSPVSLHCINDGGDWGEGGRGNVPPPQLNQIFRSENPGFVLHGCTRYSLDITQGGPSTIKNCLNPVGLHHLNLNLVYAWMFGGSIHFIDLPLPFLFHILTINFQIYFMCYSCDSFNSLFSRLI